MASELEKLKRARSATKGWLTKSAESLAKILEQKSPDRFDLEALAAVFEKRLSNYEQAQAALELEQSQEETEADQDSQSEFTESLVLLRARVAKQLSKFEAGTPPSSVSVTAAQAKLPRLNLPEFDGNIVEWFSFWEAFSVNVDSTDLPDVTKLTYLRSLLKGEAKKSVDGLALTSESYAATCELLKQRFGRKDLVIFSHIQALLEMSPSPIRNLQDLVDALLVHVRSLESLGVTGESYGVILNPILLSRLPQEVRLEWAREAEGREADLDHLIKFLKKEVDRRGRSCAYAGLTTAGQSAAQTESRSATRPERGVRRGARRSDAERGTAAGQLRPATRLASAAALHTAGVVCAFCGKRGHEGAQCHAFLNLDVHQRAQRVRALCCCFACLKVGHRAKDCGLTCSRCGGKHHKLLCFGGMSSANANAAAGQQAPPLTTPVSSSQPRGCGLQVEGSQRVGPQVGGVSLSCELDQHSGLNNCSVLPIVRVLVHGQGGRLVEANLLLDSGSDTSYVSTSLVQKVQPQWCGSTEVGYAVFGGGRAPPNSRDVYKLNVSGLQSFSPPAPQTLRAVAVPTICAPLSRPLLPASVLSELEGVVLAGPNVVNERVTIDILVGVDQFWQLVSGETRHLQGGAVAQKTVFGWVVSGQVSGSAGSESGCQLLCLGDIHESALRQLWSLEGVGVSDVETQESDLLTKFESTVTMTDGRYEVALPWKEGGAKRLQDNRAAAEKRLGGLTRKLERDPELCDAYNNALGSMESAGVIEEVPSDEVSNSVHPVFLLTPQTRGEREQHEHTGASSV